MVKKAKKTHEKDKEKQGDKSVATSADAVAALLDKQDKKKAERLAAKRARTGAAEEADNEATSRKSKRRRAAEDPSLHQSSVASFMIASPSNSSSEEEEDQQPAEQEDEANDGNEAAVVKAMRADLCENTKNALTILQANPMFAELFKVDSKKLKQLSKSSKAQRAMSEAFEPIPTAGTSTALVPYDEQEDRLIYANRQRQFWFESPNKNYEEFNRAMSSFRKLTPP